MSKTTFKTIYEMQRKLNRSVIPKWDDKCVKNNQKWIRNMYLALQQEIAEGIDSTNWKWWKKMKFDLNNSKIEAVDCLHFLMSIFQLLDMDTKEIFDLYLKKNKLNFERQEKGYKTGTYKKVVNGKEDNEKLFK